MATNIANNITVKRPPTVATPIFQLATRAGPCSGGTAVHCSGKHLRVILTLMHVHVCRAKRHQAT